MFLVDVSVCFDVLIKSLPKKIKGEVKRFEYIIRRLVVNAIQRCNTCREVRIVCYVAIKNTENWERL